ncbi:hypothetical protein ASF60_13535 [Methylobacterium sp. Leaf113]|uniref:hypothetical protein n=1 Tax=Methylobacterium sp. Leaf113 TaxID=1736259 RepID=UPI0006FC5EDC|nr:hypothetical protein [Methylobacterium sp. Leaf113]KQP94121.1 hypothetical protein ASF60_13535 [Methylobacterium sp. Leaf113]
MRSLILALAVANPCAALADEGPWSAPNWYVGVVQQAGPFTHVTGMHVSRNARAGRDDVELTCSVTDRRSPRDAVIIRRKGKALFRQGSWCGDAGDLGEWCVPLEYGASMKWFGRTPCAAGMAEFSTGD